MNGNACINFIAHNCAKVSVGLVIKYCNGIADIHCLTSAERINDAIVSSTVHYTEEKEVPNVKFTALIHGVDHTGLLTSWIGSYMLHLSRDCKKLNVKAFPEKNIIEPGGKTLLNISVEDFLTHKPTAGAEVAIFVVDEATLDILGYSPIQRAIEQTFYPLRDLDFQSKVLRSISNRSAIGKANIPLIMENPESPKDIYGHPGGRIVPSVPKLKDRRFRSHSSEPVVLEILDTAGTEQLYVLDINSLKLTPE